MRVRGEMGCKREKERVIRDVGGDIWESGIRKTKSRDGISRRSKPSINSVKCSCI